MTSQPDDTPGDEDLGRLIRAQRRRRHLTIDALAGELGVHRSTLSRWEAGDVTPSPTHLAALERALGVRIIDDGGTWEALSAVPDVAPDVPQVVVIVASTAEAVDAVFDRLGIPPAPHRSQNENDPPIGPGGRSV